MILLQDVVLISLGFFISKIIIMLLLFIINKTIKTIQYLCEIQEQLKSLKRIKEKVDYLESVYNVSKPLLDKLFNTPNNNEESDSEEI